MASSCPHPFISEALFPSTGGWLVDDVRLGVWPSIPVLLSLVWLLVTYIIFPVGVTQRHYLNVAPTIGFMCISIGFIIPARGTPRECFNEITPNDMRNDALSALFGVVLYFGAWIVIISAFFRSLALHLTGVWEIKLTQLYKQVTLSVIFVGSAALVTILLTVSGMEYTFGRISYIVPNHDRATFWAPLLAISAASLGLQFLTITYCTVAVLRPWFKYQKLRWRGYTPSFDFDRDRNIQQTAARIRAVIRLQWRNSLITTTILVYVCFLAGVFMQLRQFHEYPEAERLAWFECLESTKGDRLACLPLAKPLGPSEAELIAVLFLLVLSGSLALAFFFRIPMIRAWIDLFQGKRKFRRTSTPVDPWSVPARVSYQYRPPSFGDFRARHAELNGYSAQHGELNDYDLEMPNRDSEGRFSHFPASDIDTGSISKPQTIPTTLT